MRIAILADPIDNQHAGVHVYTKEMVDAMIRTNPGHELILIREKKDPRQTGAKQIAIRNTHLPVGYASFRLFFLVPLVLHKQKADVVIEPAHFGPFNLLPSIRRVTIIHDLTPILFPNLHRWHSQFLQKIFLKRILNHTDLIIANSDHTAGDICRVYPSNCKKVRRIYPGIRAAFGPVTDQKPLSHYNIRMPYFLFVGTIEPRKNLTVLLEAYRLYRESDAGDAQLVIAGGKGWKSESFESARKVHPFRKDIVCTGYVETGDLPALYSNCLAMIYPSLYEGFGFPVVEAMRCGAPVIASNNSSLPEAGGKAALYFDAADPVMLSQCMLAIAQNRELRENLSQLSLEQASRFNWDDFAREFWKQLESA